MSRVGSGDPDAAQPAARSDPTLEKKNKKHIFFPLQKVE